MSRIQKIDGLPIKDAKRPVKLVVEDDDIKRARTKNPNSCVVARACRRAFDAEEVRVHLSRVYVKNAKDEWVRYFTPENLRSEIIAFDRGGRFHAGEYTLGRVTLAQRKKRGERYGSDTNENVKRRKRRPYTRIEDVRVAMH